MLMELIMEGKIDARVPTANQIRYPKCPVCGREEEDGGHLFFKCKIAKQVWQSLLMERERMSLAILPSVWDVTAFIMKAKEEHRLKMVILMWFLWSERNTIRAEGRRRSAEVLAHRIRIYIDEVIKLQGVDKQRKEKLKARWSRPPEGVLKLNCDASFKLGTSSGSWGFLIRDCDGDVVVTGRGKIDHLLSAFQAELISCQQGVHVALNLGIGRLILETDALMVQQALISEDFSAMPEGGLVDELKSLVFSSFIQFECVFKGRDCNRAAHAMAELGYECVEGEELITRTVPSNVDVIVAAELSADE